MKNLKKMIISILGMLIIAALSSCSAFYCPATRLAATTNEVYNATNGVSNAVNRCADSPIFYSGRNYTLSGVKIVGDRGKPNALKLRDMNIYRVGLVMSITNGNDTQLIRRFDLRIDQDVQEVFHATTLNGIPVEVRIVVHGPHDVNTVTIYDGKYSDYFRMR